MTAPEYLDPVRHELHQLRADNDQMRATLARLASELLKITPRASDFSTRSALIALSRLADSSLLAALADKEPTP